MTTKAIDLDRLQQWMQTVILERNGVRAGASSSHARRHIDLAPEQIEEVIGRSHALSGGERLAIYGRSYFARLVECLRAEFPVLLHALGEQVFDLFALDYLQINPPSSHTLHHLGEGFCRYLAETRPNASTPQGHRESWPDFLIDLAALERAFSEVFDGPGVEGKTSLPDSRSLLSIPPPRLLRARLTPVPCLRLLRFRFPVKMYFQEVRHRVNPKLPQAADTFLLITRWEYRVALHDLSRRQYDLFSALAAGNSVGSAITLISQPSEANQTLDAQALRWIFDWAEKGLFLAVDSEEDCQ